ncbi:hypothetical protein BDF19DRAFT_473764 [Syncephalis fuscata]|nr:hypothetical protein BDF19DRAFT_473764 [Syncephalis fuscata]
MSTAMEVLVKQVLEAKDHNQLLQLLTSTPTKILAEQTPEIDPLELLDPAVNSLGYLYFLVQRSLAEAEFDKHAARLLRFAESFSREQVTLAPATFNQLGKIVIQWVSCGLNPAFGIRALTIALQRFQPTPGHFTRLHSSILELALKTRRPHLALPVLEQPIIHIDARILEKKVEPFLLYHTMEVMTTPIYNVSAIQVAAYKKYVLVSLICHGKLVQLPQYTPSSVLRTCRSYSSLYHEIAPLFESNSIVGLDAFLGSNRSLLKEDGNYTLAQSLLHSLRSHIIKGLTKIYSNMSLARIANEAGLKNATEAEHHILKMIDARELQAQITRSGTVKQAEGTVQFGRPAAIIGQLPVGVSQSDIAALMQRIATLSETVRNTELELAASKKYIDRNTNLVIEDIAMEEVDYMVGNISSAAGAEDFY